MYKKAIISAGFILALLALQIAFVSALPGWLSALNLVIVALVYFTGLKGAHEIWFWVLFAGFFWDIFVFSPPGSHPIGLLACLMLVDFFHNNFFTNRSVYSFLALTALATAFFRFWQYVYAAFYSLFAGQGALFHLNGYFWLDQLKALAVNAVFTVMVFAALSYISYRFTAIFISAKKQ